jgi:hypothetical protein
VKKPLFEFEGRYDEPLDKNLHVINEDLEAAIELRENK